MSTLRILLGLLLALPASVALAQKKMPWEGLDLDGRPCTIPHAANNYGAFDYTNPVHLRNNLNIVEAHHFTPKVENLIDGETGALLADLEYTIRAFPNHHRALYALIRYQLSLEHKLHIPPECWVDRAIAFKPDDAALYVLYGLYLHQRGKLDLALKKYQRAEALSPDYSELYYNMGLLYLDKGDAEHALEYARKAYALKYPLPGLRQRLQERGYSVSH